MRNQQVPNKTVDCNQCIYSDICKERDMYCSHFDNGEYEDNLDMDYDEGYLEDVKFKWMNLRELGKMRKNLGLYGYTVNKVEIIKDEQDYISKCGECVTRKMTDEEKKMYKVK